MCLMGNVRGPWDRVCAVLGGNSSALAQAGGEVHALEDIGEVVDACKVASAARVTVRGAPADAVILPWSDGTLDVGLHYDLLGHFQTTEQARALAENWRRREPREILGVDASVDRPERL